MKNIKYCIVPMVIILMQGTYTNIQSFIAVLLSLAFLRKVHASLRQLVGVFVMVLGFVVSDLISHNGFNFIYESINAALLLMGMSFSASKFNKLALAGVYQAVTASSILGVIAYLIGLEGNGIIKTIDGVKVLQGFCGYANTNALFCGVGIVLAIYYIGEKSNYEFLHEIALVINIVAFVLTKSIFGYICLIFSVLVIVYVKFKVWRRYLVGLALFAFIIASGLFFTGNKEILLQSTVASRLIYWHDALRVMLRRPFGIGVHNWENIQYSIQSADYSVKYIHNGFLQLVLDGGMISLSGFVFVLLSGCKGLIEKYKLNDKQSLYLLSILIFIIVHSFTDINLAYGGVWFIIGLLMPCEENGKNAESKIALPVFISVLAVMVCVVPEKEFVNQFRTSYRQAYEEKDLNEMDEISAGWIEYAPRQQEAYDARYYVLEKLNDKEGLVRLYAKKDEINSSMNPMCRYLIRHKKIVLPEMSKK